MIGFITNTLPSNRFGDRTEFNMHSCHGVELALQNTPLDLREAVYKKYGKRGLKNLYVFHHSPRART